MDTGKKNKIKESVKETKAKRAMQRCHVVELKVDSHKLSKNKNSVIAMMFVQCKWLYNYMLNLEKEELYNYNTKNKVIYSLDKDGNQVERILTLPSQIKQKVHKQLCDNIKALSKLKNSGKKIGKLKFKSDYNSIDLKQYGNSHKIVSNNRIHITGLGEVKVYGLEQIHPDWEYANAKLIKKPSGYYILLTCYENLTLNKVNNNLNKVDCGLDFGIKTNITTSDGEKYSVWVEETERLKNLQRKKSRQVKGSNNYKRTCHLIELEYEKMSNIKKDKTNKLVSYLCQKYNRVYIQDEMIASWHKGLFGKQVQHSFMGRLKERLKEQPNVSVISKSYPTTKMCYNCGEVHTNITLNDREFICQSCGFSEDRDIKAAKTVMFIGQCLNNFVATEYSCKTHVERLSDFLSSYEGKKHSAKACRPKTA